MIYSTLFLFASLACVANAQNCSTPLNVVLWDLFGDTWNGAEYFVEKPSAETFSTSPDCEHNPRLVRVLFDPVQSAGLYYMTVNTPGNYIPHEWWEIFWTVRVGDTNEFYTGGYNTTMVWDFDLANCRWNLMHYINLWNNTKDCDGCGGANECPAKPKPKPKPPAAKGDAPAKKNADGNNGDGDNGEEEVEDNDFNNSTVNSPSYGPPAVDVEVTMYDAESDGWWLTNYLGTSWYIYDTTRTALFETGTLCNFTNGACKLCLGDGNYIYRATYDKNLNSTYTEKSDRHVAQHNANFTAWDFCGVSGHYSDELHFHVKKGKCVADYITCLDDICDDIQVFANIQVLGSMLVSGVSSNDFDSADSNVFVSAFVKEVTGMKTSNVAVLSSAVDSTLSVGASKSFVVSFVLNFVTDSTFALDGTANAAVDTLVTKMHSSLNTQIASGEYVSAVHSAALSSHVGAMSSVNGVSLLSFELKSVTYSGSRDMIVGKTMVADVQMEDTFSGAGFDFTAISFFLAFVGVGLIVVAGVYSRRMVAYSKLSQESTHEISQSLELDGGLVLPAVRSVSDRSRLTL